MRRLVTILLSATLLFASCIKDRESCADLRVGDILPEFIVTMNDGSTVGTEQLKGGIGCIIFFTTACPDCQETLPQVQKVYDEYASKGVTFAVISREEGSGKVADYWTSEGLTMPYSAQESREIYELFAATRIPRVYVCKEGVIRTIFTDTPSNPTYEDIKAAIEELMN